MDLANWVRSGHHFLQHTNTHTRAFAKPAAARRAASHQEQGAVTFCPGACKICFGNTGVRALTQFYGHGNRAEERSALAARNNAYVQYGESHDGGRGGRRLAVAPPARESEEVRRRGGRREASRRLLVLHAFYEIFARKDINHV